jgi:hypothetical protein
MTTDMRLPRTSAPRRSRRDGRVKLAEPSTAGQARRPAASSMLKQASGHAASSQGRCKQADPRRPGCANSCRPANGRETEAYLLLDHCCWHVVYGALPRGA